jgi:hypothetical protein
VRVTALAGDAIRDMAFSPDEKWIVYRITRGGGSWFEVADIGAGVLDEPVPVTPTDPAGLANNYRAFMSLRPSWTSNNFLIYPSFGAGSTPGIFSRDLSGLLN